MKTYHKFFMFIFTALILTALASPSFSYAFEIKGACTQEESFSTQDTKKPPRWYTRYQAYLKKENTIFMGFSDALYLRRIGLLLNTDAIERDFSEYWVGRVFFQAGLFPLAHQFFNSVYNNTQHAEMKAAAFRCLSEIQKRDPDWLVPKDITDLLRLKLSSQQWEDLADGLFLWGLRNIDSIQVLVPKLPKIHQSYLLALHDALKKKYQSAAEQAKIFTHHFEDIKSDLVKHQFLSRYLDSAYLLLGRSLYSLGRFTDSIKAFQSIQKTSNQQIDALSDLSWAYLQAGQSDDAIGIAIQLRSGNLNNAFAPEPLMVAAIALNEVCNYPDSTYFISAFFKDYESTFKWLKSTPVNFDYYAEVLKALKKQSLVPPKITSEWMKNKAFLTRQIEINTLIEQPKLASALKAQAFTEQQKLTEKYLTESREFIQEVKKATLKLKPQQELDAQYGEQHLKLKRELRRLIHFYHSSKTWNKLTQAYYKKIPQLKADLVKKINHDLKDQTQLIQSKLADLKENTYMIEVEIYNGASQDLVFKNAHPTFSSEKINIEKEKNTASEVYSWGRFQKQDLDQQEVWEDELGTLKADTTDQCQKKERYLKLKSHSRP